MWIHIKKIWNDPVWSKVISAIFIALLFSIYAKYTGSFSNVWNIEIPFIFVIILFFIFWIYFSLIYNKKRTRYTKKQKELMKFNQISNKADATKFTWEVGFNGNRIYAYNLMFFCTNHEIHLKFLNKSCPDEACENATVVIDFDKCKNMIESLLEDKWSKMIK